MDHGPVTVAVRSTSAFQAYNGGIFNSCSTGPVNHAVVIVGWDDAQGANGVWIIRNSWGTGWGEAGYMRIAYGCSSIGYAACYVDYQVTGGENHAPILSNPRVSPPSGAPNTTYYFLVDYYDADGDPPHPSYRDVFISGGLGGTMSLVSGTASHGTYRYWTPLEAGAYNHSFLFCDDNYECDVTSWEQGPNVYAGDVPLQFNFHGTPLSDCLELRYSVPGTSGSVKLPVGDGHAEVAVPPGSQVFITGGTCCPSYECVSSSLYVNGDHVGDYDCDWWFQLGPNAQYATIDVYWEYRHDITYPISGMVLRADGSPVPGGVDISLNSPEQDELLRTTNGNFSFSAKGGVPVTLAFEAAGYSFSPPTITFTDLCEAETGVAITAVSGDVLVPTVTLVAKPPAVADASSVSFTWSGQDDVSATANLQYRYRLEGYDADWSTWSGATSKAYDLANGVYTFSITARDEAGNENAAPEGYAFVVNASPRISSVESLVRSVWATRVTLSMPASPTQPTSSFVLLPSLSPEGSELVPVTLHRKDDPVPLGVNAMVAGQLEKPALISGMGPAWLVTLPDPVTHGTTATYDIVWGAIAYFGWEPYVVLPHGFPNGGSVGSAYLDDNLVAWRNATKYDTQGTSAFCDNDGWVFGDAVSANGVVMGELAIRYVPGLCWGGADTGAATQFGSQRGLRCGAGVCFGWDEERDTWDGNTDSYDHRLGLACFDPNGPPYLRASVDGSYYPRTYHKFPARQLACGDIWIVADRDRAFVGEDGLEAWFQVLDCNGTVMIPRTVFDVFSHSNNKGLRTTSAVSIGDNVLLAWSREWKTSGNDDRAQIVYQLRDCSGSLAQATQTLTPVQPDSVAGDDVYRLYSSLAGRDGKVWLSYSHNTTQGTTFGYLVLGSGGGVWRGMTQTPVLWRFVYCDTDGKIWVQADTGVSLFNEDGTLAYGEKTNTWAPSQGWRTVAAAVDQSGGGYRLYDRWSAKTIAVEVPSGAHADSMQIFDLDLWGNGLHLVDLAIDIDGNTIPFQSGQFTGYSDVSVATLLGQGDHVVTMKQEDLIGGQILVTFPYRVCSSDADCDDGVACTVDRCEIASNACRNVASNGLCDDGLFCDGIERCDAESGCQVGTPPECADGIACTVDSCDEEAKTCAFVPSNGLCSGTTPFCDQVLGCTAPPTGACCLWPQRGCLTGQTESFCVATLRGVFAGPNTTCPGACERGACCNVVDGGCSDAIESQCMADNQNWLGSGTDCSLPSVCQTPGACCLGDGACADAPAAECQAMGGVVWGGLGSSCASFTCYGGCCVGGTCVVDQSFLNCASVAGVWAGPGVDCTPDPCMGACCVGAVCVGGQKEANCSSAGGEWAGYFTTCPADAAWLCPVCADGDMNGDREVDLHDFARMQWCFAVPYSAECNCCDLNEDFKVDEKDLTLFETGLTGP